jgi:hypothetical protein
MADSPMPITGVVQHYAWGDLTFIPELLHTTADGRPWAELWLGTHPNGPATIDGGGSLVETTGELGYLLKVLAATRPLSLQVHPTTEQALDGHARGVYPDDRAKPELLCALTRFDALCGIRPIAATLTLLGALGAEPLAAAIRSDGIGTVIEGLYRGRIDPRPTLVACARSQRPERAAAFITGSTNGVVSRMRSSSSTSTCFSVSPPRTTLSLAPISSMPAPLRYACRLPAVRWSASPGCSVTRLSSSVTTTLGSPGYSAARRVTSSASGR